MTEPGSGLPSRDSMMDDTPRRGIGRDIIAVLAAGLVFRLILAYGIPGLRGSGFDTDLNLFRYWADTLAKFGPWGFYANASYADYTPGYLYALWPVGLLGQALGGVGDLIKIPAILTDTALAWLVYSMAMELGVSHRRALTAAAVIVVNPVTWFDSVIWGQVDSYGTVFLLLAVRELWRGRHERSAILAVFAALVKPQLAILVPIVALVVIRRAFWPEGAWGDEGAPTVGRTRLEERLTGRISVLSTALAGFLTGVLVCLPFNLTVIHLQAEAPYVGSTLLKLVLTTAGVYPYLTVNAYNMWALFPVDGASTASAGTWFYDSPAKDAQVWGMIGPFTAATFGAILLLSIAAIAAIRVARRPDRLTILVGTAVIAFAFFAAPTRVHERYLFPFFGLTALLVAASWRWRWAYMAASLATFLNMYVVLTTLYGDMNPHVSDWLGIGPWIRSWFGVFVVAVLHTGAFAWVVAQLRPAAMRRLSVEMTLAGVDAEAEPVLPRLDHGDLAADPPVPWPADDEADDEADAAAGAADDGPRAAAAAAGAPSRSAALSTARRVSAAPPAPLHGGSRDRDRRLVPAWYDRIGWGETGPVDWIRARFAETPIRPDRSAVLRHEGRGRWDRLDAFLLVVLVLASLFLRGYRLAEPARMHFDEVYHARTATEFLQDWRYGISHDIYEWTHPHLAKYVMAGGIVAFAGHDVASSSDLGVPVRDALVEPRREDPVGELARAGDRLWVATGTELRAYDLESRKLLVTWPLPGAAVLAYDDTSNTLLVGTDDGGILTLDASALDVDRTAPVAEPVPLVTLESPARALAPYSDAQHIAVLLDGGVVVSVDASSGAETGRTTVDGATGILPIGEMDGVIATLADVTDPAAEAEDLAGLLGGDPAVYEQALAQQDVDSVTLDASLAGENRTALQAEIDAGNLPGIAIGPVPSLAVAGAAGVTFLSTAAAVTNEVALDGPAIGLAHVSGVEEGTQLYTGTTSPEGTPQIAVITVSGDNAKDGPDIAKTFETPGQVTRLVFDPAAELVEALGTAPDGSGQTVYVIEPHGKAVFADHRLPDAPVALALDHNEDYPSTSRGELLALSSGGTVSALDVGHYPFAWRLPGVIFGALTAGVLFLLGRLLFKRRAVGVAVGLFVLLDGMFFVQSRIAMNDVYVGFFILAAYLVFAWLWLDPPRSRWAFWVAMPTVGILLGLALASKWVAAYAIGALGILYLARSALGRVLLILGMIAVTAVLGWMGLAVPAGSDGSGNLPFILIMIALTLGAVAITVFHPVAWSFEETWFAVAAPAALGMLIALAGIAKGIADQPIVLGPVSVTPLNVGFALVLASGVVYAAFGLVGRWGFGPMARARIPDPDEPVTAPPSPAPEGWLRMGWGLGLPLAWFAVSLLVLPIAVYVALYLPWAFVENHQLFTNWPDGHTGQSLADLTGSMYGYHNNLTAPHAASSPWWAWLLNMKPVWFYQGGFAGSTAGAIYDAGNLVIWWMGVPAMLFAGVQAFRRRNLALALITVGFLAQWVAWARIDRAAFQYHYYTSLPFITLALGYFTAEIWNGPSRRTWGFARIASALALMGPIILWILRYPLCSLANVESVNKGSQACNGNPGNLEITMSTGALVVVALVMGVILVRQLVALGRPRADGSEAGSRDLVPVAITAMVGIALMLFASKLPSSEPLLTFNGIVPELIALVAAVPLGIVAVQVLTARDARRWVVGLVSVAGAWFLVLYPNISALQMPSVIVNFYQGILPTYLYAFQFTVNQTDRSGAISFSDVRFLVLVLFLVVAAGVVAYSSWAWRQALAEPMPLPAPDDADAVAGAADAGDAGTADPGAEGARGRAEAE